MSVIELCHDKRKYFWEKKTLRWYYQQFFVACSCTLNTTDLLPQIFGSITDRVVNCLYGFLQSPRENYHTAP